MATAKKKPPAASAKPVKAPRAKKAPVEPPPPVVHVSAYSVGNKVTHPTFGEGKVLSIERDQLTIKFAKDEKIILESFVKSAGK
jgi:hypothetical protein